MTDKEFVNLQRAGVILGRPLTLPFFAVLPTRNFSERNIKNEDKTAFFG